MCCSQDTIPKPDGLAWPVCDPSSNENRMHLARCPALFECVRLPSGHHPKGGAAVAAGEVVTRHPQRVAVKRPVFTPVNMSRLSGLAEARLHVFTCVNAGQA